MKGGAPRRKVEVHVERLEWAEVNSVGSGRFAFKSSVACLRGEWVCSVSFVRAGE